MAKFHERAILIYGKSQYAEGSPATVAATDAVAALEVNYTDEISSEDHVYVGDELDRDTLTSITDRSAKVDFSTLLPLIDVTEPFGTTPETLLAVAPLLKACGGSATDSETADSPEVGKTAINVTFTNSAVLNSFATLEVRRSSADEPTFERKHQITDCRGMVNLEWELGKRSMLGFNFMGNFVDPARVEQIVPNFGVQKTRIAPVLRAANVIQAELVAVGTAFTGIGTKTFCFSKLSAPNLFGFDYSRFILSCLEGFSKGAVTTDVVLTRLMDTPDTGVFMPENNLEGLFKLRVTIGTEDVDTVAVEFDKLELVNYANTAVGTYAAQDITFKNRGFTTLSFDAVRGTP